MTPERVWYLAYGSNVHEARFMRYLQGGSGPRAEPGARDPSPPRTSRWVEAPLRLMFGNRSERWNGGGVAFVEPDRQTRCWVRAWDITAEQFEDVFAQENRRPVGSGLPWDRLAAGSLVVGTGWYRRLVDLPDVAAQLTDDGRQPALTFTSPEPVSPNPPNPGYRDTIAAGLATNPALDNDRIAHYLDTASVIL